MLLVAGGVITVVLMHLKGSLQCTVIAQPLTVLIAELSSRHEHKRDQSQCVLCMHVRGTGCHSCASAQAACEVMVFGDVA